MARYTTEQRREQLVAAAIEVMSREGLERTTTRKIAQQADAAQGAINYAFRDKNELLTAVVGEVTLQVEKVLREAVDPTKGLAAAIDDALRGFLRFVVSDDGLQLMQYELTIFCRRTPGLEWLAEWQYTRYAAAARDVFGAALAHDAEPIAIDLDELCRFLVAAVDGLVIQYEVNKDAVRVERDLGNVIRCAQLLASTPPVQPVD
jgi:AcrR family transcriptional regulator